MIPFGKAHHLSSSRVTSLAESGSQQFVRRRGRPDRATMIKLRYFAEAAGLLGISARTARNYWAHARTWLYHEIKG